MVLLRIWLSYSVKIIDRALRASCERLYCSLLIESKPKNGSQMAGWMVVMCSAIWYADVGWVSWIRGKIASLRYPNLMFAGKDL